MTNVDRDNGENLSWGSQEWFAYLFTSQGDQDAAAYYTHKTNGYQIYRHTQLLKVLESHSISGRNLLDVGCATGVLTAAVARRFKFEQVVGLDFVKSMILKTASNFEQFKFVSGSLPHLPFTSNYFDLVIASEVLYYLSDDKRLIALEEINRVLKPGGCVLFSSVLGESYFSSEEAVNYVKKKFTIETMSETYNGLYHSTFGLLENVVRLALMLRKGIEPGQLSTRVRLRKYNWLIRTSFFNNFLNVITFFCTPLIRSHWIPKFSNWFSGKFRILFEATNITLIGRK